MQQWQLNKTQPNDGLGAGLCCAGCVPALLGTWLQLAELNESLLHGLASQRSVLRAELLRLLCMKNCPTS